MNLSEWSKINNIDRIQTALKSISGPLSGVTFDPSSDSSMLLYGQGFIVYVDMTQSIPKQPKIINAMSSGMSSRSGPGSGPSSILGSGPGSGPGSGISKVTGVTGRIVGTAYEQRLPGGSSMWKREKKREGSDDSNFAIIQRYKSLVHVGCVENSQLVRTILLIRCYVLTQLL